MKIELSFNEYIEMRCCVRQRLDNLEQLSKKFPSKYFTKTIKELNHLLEKTHRNKVIK